MIKSILNHIPYNHIARWWLISILLFLPFENVLRIILKKINLIDITHIIRRLDEFTIVVFLPLAVWKLLKDNNKYDRAYNVLLLPILALSIHGILSGMINGNYWLATVHGTFDYVKYFFVIFIFSAFFRTFDDFKRVFHLVLVIAVFLGAIAFIQEIWAVGQRYILKRQFRDIHYIELVQFLSPDIKRVSVELWRAGIFRTHSLMTNANFLGLYMILMIVMYTHTIKKVNIMVLVSLYSGIFGSASRVVYTSFAVIGGIQIFKGHKWWIVGLIPIVIILFYLSPLPEYLKAGPSSAQPMSRSQLEGKEPLSKEQIAVFNRKYKNSWDSYRSHAGKIANEIWHDHLFMGVGPGMYGGGISIKYKSPVYEEYNFHPVKRLTLEKWHTIDQFWNQLLAELGIIGILCFAWFFIALARILLIYKNNVYSDEEKGLYTGLATYLLVILLYAIGYDFNVPPIIFTYFAFVGIGLSIGRRRGNNTRFQISH